MLHEMYKGNGKRKKRREKEYGDLGKWKFLQNPKLNLWLICETGCTSFAYEWLKVRKIIMKIIFENNEPGIDGEQDEVDIWFSSLLSLLNGEMREKNWWWIKDFRVQLRILKLRWKLGFFFFDGFEFLMSVINEGRKVCFAIRWQWQFREIMWYFLLT